MIADIYSYAIAISELVKRNLIAFLSERQGSGLDKCGHFADNPPNERCYVWSGLI
jgi:hypothetical protein